MRYTLAVTSCGRHDLLKRTLESFAACADIEPAATVILEDGPLSRPDWLRGDLAKSLGGVTWLNNFNRLGQAYSIDRLYDCLPQTPPPIWNPALGSKPLTDYIFWLEDDWYFSETGFIGPSIEILQNHPDISMVALRKDWNHPLVKDAPDLTIAQPYWGGGWGGMSWNPGLRRVSDFRRFGNYGRHVGYGESGLQHELKYSKMYLDEGYRIACLPKFCSHIGDGRSRAIEPLPPVPKILIALLACHEKRYGQWESSDSPHFDLSKAWNGEPYGTDLHISGTPDPGISAVRQTWARDAAVFPSLDVKFFYGTGSSRQPEGDEVFLPVPDDYAHLPEKSFELIRWAYDRNYDFIFKCDTDTFVFVDRLVREILENPGLEYGGCLNCNVCTGGPGYLLSRKGMAAVSVRKPKHPWAEDHSVAYACEEARIVPQLLPGHQAGGKSHWFNFDSGFAGIVTAHAVRPEKMRQIYGQLTT